MYYGGDYNPEQWPEPVWDEDVRLMREAGVNLVSLGVFAWARIQRAEGEFDFGWLDRVLDKLHAGGIGVNLATATASPPPWASRVYPEILPKDASGATYWPGSRQAYAPTSPVYRRLAAELVTAIAERYARHPAVVMWHVNNEYGCHLHADYSDNAAVAFRAWLRGRYDDIEALNDAWGTAFWSQRYGDFEEIVPPRLAPYSVNPAGLLDFKRFTSDALLGLYRMEKSIIRAAGGVQPVTTNLIGAFEPADYRSWAADLDLIADDSYPDPADPESFRGAAFTRDLMRSLKPGVPWVLMEQATDAVNWRPSNVPKAPGQMAALSVQAVARGADGVMFFQWRQSRSGSEKFHSAMVPHAGTGTRTWKEVVELGRSLAAFPRMSAEVEAPVALLYDWQNRWAVENSDHPVRFDHLAIVQQWHAAVHRRHVGVDVRHPGDDLSRYAVVIAPQLYLLTDASAANLASYVAGGGTLLLSAFSDVVDEHDRFPLGGFTTRLAATLGLRVTDFGALPLDDAHEAAAVTVSFDGASLKGRLFAEELDVVDATVLGRFGDGRLRGRPAFTSRVSGSGTAYYLATVPDEEGMRALTARILADAGVRPVAEDLPPHVEAVVRDGYLFVVNHSGEPFTPSSPFGRPVEAGSEAGDVIGAHGWRVFGRAAP
ncbi:beta-galactosidase [Streptosporangium sp. NPDC050855]|uniref:beta-galactosidase n=1 Tax=Streptosporangium sp. NPDC050855 TaxID=3366194 RepID=UPI0037872BDB